MLQCLALALSASMKRLWAKGQERQAVTGRKGSRNRGCLWWFRGVNFWGFWGCVFGFVLP